MKIITKNLMLFSCVLILFQCQNEDAPIITGNLETIPIDNLIDFIPVELISGKHIIYKNELGNEKKLQSSFLEDETERNIENQKYIGKQFTVRLIDESDSRLNIEISGDGLYGSNLERQQKIVCFLMPGNSSGSAVALIEFDEGLPSLNSNINDYLENINFLGKSFNDVYRGASNPKVYNSYSEVYFTSDEGIIAFRDRDDMIWVFDRYETQ